MLEKNFAGAIDLNNIVCCDIEVLAESETLLNRRLTNMRKLPQDYFY